MDIVIRRQALWQRGRVRDLAALALLLVLCLLFFWRVVTPNPADRASFRQGDFYNQFYAFAIFEFNQLTSGRLPLWNPYTYSGHPFLADVQSAVYYPVSLATMLLSLASGFSAFALELETIAHFYLGAVFTYLLARRLLGSRAGALFSAITFTFGGYLTSYPALQLAILETVIWLPLILLLIDLGASELGGRTRLGFLYLVLAGLAFGIALLAGHPQSAMYTLYVSLLYFLLKLWQARRPGADRVAYRSFALGAATFLLVGLGLAAAQIIPSLEFMRLSSRPDLSYQELAGGFAYLDFIQILLPHATSFWSPLYIGIFPLLMSLFALYLLICRGGAGQTVEQRRRWRAEVLFWTILAAITLLLSVGDDSFLYSLFYVGVPGFGLFRDQERAALVFSLALSLLAGYGFTALMVSVKESQARDRYYHAILRILIALALGIVGLTTLFFLGSSTAGAPPGGTMDTMLGLGVFVSLLLGASLAWLLLWQHRPSTEWLVLSLAICLVVVDLFTVNSRPNVQKRKLENQYQATPAIKELQVQPGTFRIHNDFRLPGNYGPAHGLEDTWGSSPLRLADYERFMARVPLERAWALLNVRYVVTWLEHLSVSAEPVFEEPAKRGEVTYIHRLEAEHPRVWIVYEAEVVSSQDMALDRVAEPGFDPYRLAVLDTPAGLRLRGQATDAPQARLAVFSPSRLVVEVDHASDGLLVLSELYYPGWRATVDGRQAPIYRTDAILRAVEVPAGQHQVEMVFDPLSVKLGLAISGITLLLSLAYLAWYVIGGVRKLDPS
jgi:hypothetical protein